ncbi:MAG: hydrogenase nickel incorporation protein HypB [Planctomycetota bacterium]
MCGTCGCSTKAHADGAIETQSQLRDGASSHAHAHDHHADDSHAHDHVDDHGHVHDHGHEDERTMELGRLVLGENERLAERVRGILLAKGIAAINVVSSPGSGKTTLLERTLERIADTGLKTAVLVGDLATDNDARRLSATGTQAIQITTGNVCHLDAHMILHGLEKLDLAEVDVLFLENVGNLVCPAAFDLGEDHRVVLSSVTEGEDKPLKYPTIFDGADLALVTKMDLAEVLETDLDALHSAIRDVAPAARIVDVSARSGDGLDAWVQFIVEAAERKRAVAL